MRLATLTLERYGPFERLELPFDPAPARLNLIVAPNGYGKSVIRTAIGDLLFGIPERTGMDFRFGTERMRLVADVVHADGRSTLIRRKGRGNTLAYADGAPVPPEAVRAMLGSADRDVFQELFGLDTELLRRGGQELIRSQGLLGQVLFAAGGGMGGGGLFYAVRADSVCLTAGLRQAGVARESARAEHRVGARGKGKTPE